MTDSCLFMQSLISKSHQLQYMKSKSSLSGELLSRVPPKYNPDT